MPETRVETSTERFIRTFEMLAGKARRASSPEGAAAAAIEIVREIGAKTAALGEMPEAYAKPLRAALDAAGVRYMAPPFDRKILPHAIDEMEVGITMADFGVAESGSLGEIATNDANRLVSTLPRTHIGILRANTLVPMVDDAAPLLRKAFVENPGGCVVTFISGPSRTGDIEMKLTLGVHGPEAACAIVVE